jgi:hypothetical protein
MGVLLFWPYRDFAACPARQAAEKKSSPARQGITASLVIPCFGGVYSVLLESQVTEFRKKKASLKYGVWW